MRRARRLARVLRYSKTQLIRLQDHCVSDLAAVQDERAAMALRKVFVECQARVEDHLWRNFNSAIEPWLRGLPPDEELERAATAAGCCLPSELDKQRWRNASEQQPGLKI